MVKLSTMSYYDRVKEAADALRSRVSEVPSIGVVLGSGLGGFAQSMHPAVSIPYAELPHWPVSRVAGHDGRAVVGKLCGRTTIALAGRCHIYEGHSAETVTFAVRALGLLGVRILILTNAAGGIRSGFSPGALMVIDDHVNLMGCNPLVGPNDDRFGPRFPDMSSVYSTRLRTIADEAGEAGHLPLVAWHVCGCRRAQLRNASRDPILADDRGRRRRDVDGPRSHRRPTHGNGSPRPFVHQQYGRRRVAAAS